MIIQPNEKVFVQLFPIIILRDLSPLDVFLDNLLLRWLKSTSAITLNIFHISFNKDC